MSEPTREPSVQVPVSLIERITRRLAKELYPDMDDVEELAALLSQPTPSAELKPTRKHIESAVGAVLFNASNYPRPAVPHILGQDIAPLRSKVTDAVLALFHQPNSSVGVAPSCGFDTELYAAAYNDGWDAAVAQEMQDHPLAFAAALRAAADRVEEDAPPATYQQGYDDGCLAGEHNVRNAETPPHRD